MNKIGVAPTPKGPSPGLVDEETLVLLAQAFETHVCLNQINQEQRKNKRLSLLKSIQQVMSPYWTPGPCILHQLLMKCSIHFNFEVATPMEERRTKWTTSKYLSLWFNKWEQRLGEVGFGSMIDGKFVIPNDQLQQIMNIDETALSLVSSNGRCGGRPTAEFSDPNLPTAHRRTSKSAITVTMITGSSAAGEAIAPHFQFPSKATDQCNAKLPIEVIKTMKGVIGWFGMGEETEWGCTLGTNKKRRYE